MASLIRDGYNVEAKNITAIFVQRSIFKHENLRKSRQFYDMNPKNVFLVILDPLHLLLAVLYLL